MLVMKNLTAKARDSKRGGSDPWVRKIPWRRAWQPTPVFLPGEPHGQRSLAGHSPWGCRESGMTGQLPLTPLSKTGAAFSNQTQLLILRV